MAYQRAFYFGCAKSVASHIENVINSADDPEIAVLIATRTVCGEVIAGELAPILFFVALLVAVNCAQHRRPRPAHDEFSTYIRSNFMSLFIDYNWVNAEKRQRCAAGLCCNRTRQWRDQNRSCFG